MKKDFLKENKVTIIAVVVVVALTIIVLANSFKPAPTEQELKRQFIEKVLDGEKLPGMPQM